MRQHHDGGALVGRETLQGFLGPGHDELVGARNALRSGKTSPSIGDDRPPAKPLRRTTELLGEIDGAEDE